VPRWAAYRRSEGNTKGSVGHQPRQPRRPDTSGRPRQSYEAESPCDESAGREQADLVEGRVRAAMDVTEAGLVAVAPRRSCVHPSRTGCRPRSGQALVFAAAWWHDVHEADWAVHGELNALAPIGRRSSLRQIYELLIREWEGRGK
jgi:hypothetical protein